MFLESTKNRFASKNIWYNLQILGHILLLVIYNITYNYRLVQYLGNNVAFDDSTCTTYKGNSKDKR